MIRTYKYKLYNTKRLKHLDRTLDIAGIIYNHCIALHKRYYRLFGKSLNKYQLQKHLTKLKKLPKCSHFKLVPSQAIQDITDRIDKAYKLFFRNQKKGIKSSPSSFKKVKKYKSFTLKQAGYKIDGNIISLKHLKELKRLQKRVFKKQKNSNNFKLAKRRLAKLHIKVANTRRDYFHKLSNKIANNVDFVQ